MNQLSYFGRGMIAIELEDMTHLRLLATSLPSSEMTNLYFRQGERRFGWRPTPTLFVNFEKFA